MKKTLAIALASATVLGMAAPAFAGPFGDGSTEMRELKAWGVLTQLQQEGVNATAVEAHGNNILAFVTTADGKQIMETFDPITLKPVVR